MSTLQMNTRIDEVIKHLGDDAFASINYTPSRMVQAVWEFAARNRTNKAALRKLAELIEEPSEPVISEKEEKLKLIREGPSLFTNLFKEMGIKELDYASLPSDDELLFQAYEEKMAERGIQT